jgi:hypothetical protein
MRAQAMKPEVFAAAAIAGVPRSIPVSIIVDP